MADSTISDILDYLAGIGLKDSVIGPIPLPVRLSGNGKRGIVAGFMPVYSRILDVEMGSVTDFEKRSELLLAFQKLCISNQVGIMMEEIKR